MNLKVTPAIALLGILAAWNGTAQTPATQAMPHLEKRGAATQLIVDGKPMLVLGAELHNSTSSSAEYMEPILDRFSALHLNTVLGSVCWDLVEPEEGRFDFSQVDGLIQGARRHNMHLVLLWFGSWKNGVSTYDPVWVKRDYKRFPRAQSKDGKSLEILSTLSLANRDADARAFAAVMKHVRDVDGEAHTVLMVQVENEVGVLTETRDQSSQATAAFRAPVPKELMASIQKNKDTLIPGFRKRWEANGFKTSGSWEEVFGLGDETDEAFMAWNYARYVGKVAEAGKAQYPLPMFVNTWLDRWQETAPMKPGTYPSGGPMPHVLDIWRAGAPQLDILSPDVYSFLYERLDEYHRPWNAIFIPEMARETRMASDIFYAIGNYDAIGVSPFGLESVPKFQEDLSETYKALSQIAPVILQHQGTGTIGAAVLDKDHPTRHLQVGDYTLDVGIARHYTFPTPEFPAGIFIQLGPDEYLVSGRGVTVAFTANTPGDPITGFASVEDGSFVDGKWIAGRSLNGDEILSGKGLRLRGDRYMFQHVKLYRYR